MDTYSNPEYRLKSDLFQESSEHFIQMIAVARECYKEEEIRLFYSHIASHCLRFRGYMEHSRQNLYQPNRELIDDAVQHLGFLVPRNGLHELEGQIATTEHRLRTLNYHWNEIRGQQEDIKARFVSRWLKLEMSEERRRELDKALEDLADVLDKQIHKYCHKDSKGILASPRTSDHARTVVKAAQSLFDALLSSQSCSCTDAHEIGATLGLGTYKTLEKVTKDRPNPRKPLRSDERVDELSFDIFMSVGENRQEIQVRTTKERVMGVYLGDEEPPRPKRIAASKKLESLCKTVIRAQPIPWQRLILRLTGGRLFELGTEKSSSRIDNVSQPISLSQCFEERHEFFTEKTKRILSLMLGYMVLHLNNTSWLKPGWSSTSIQFFQTTSHKTPLRPFIQSQLPNVYLPGEGPNLQVAVDDSSTDYDISMDLDSHHRCPALIALAVILIELYFAKPFRGLAEKHEVQIIEQPHGRILLVDVDQVLNGDEEIGLEGCRLQIPQDTLLLGAIDNCLDTSLWEDDEGAPLDSTTLTSRIYQHVVRLLELHLTYGFSYIPLDGIDKHARNMDLGGWSQSIAPGSVQDADLVRPAVLDATPSLPLKLAAAAIDQTKSHATRVCESKKPTYPCRLYSPSQSSVTNSDKAYDPGVQLEPCQFFDDMTNGRDFAIQSAQYLIWRSEYERVYQKFIESETGKLPSNLVKVAILDTGIDRIHETIEARETNLKAWHNYHDESQRDVPDMNGHGTFAASLILDYAPDVELYVIKIADKNVLPHAKVIVKAIDHALDEWDVDIISMSFGWPSSDFDGYDALQHAIDRAYGKKVLMFAAAANSGGRCGRAYPASSSHVICVHSTDTNGNRSPFSPTAELNTINIATVGGSVHSAWPMSLCHDGEHFQTRSGTSYATPIIVGISASLLHFARLHLSGPEAAMLKRKERMEALLKRCAERGPNYQPRDGYFYVELSLNPHNLFGQDLEGVRRDIIRTLQI